MPQDPIIAEIVRLENYAKTFGLTDADLGNLQAAIGMSLDNPLAPHEWWTAARESYPQLAHISYPQPDVDSSQEWPAVASSLTPCDDPNPIQQPVGEYEMVDPNDPVIVDLKKQIADFTEGMRRIVEGKYQGAGGAAAIVVALEGGNDPTLAPQPDYVPKA